ncbi:MAG: nucleotidyltransferase family protein, partial [Myxococcota bacterium]
AAILQQHGYQSTCPAWDHHHLPPLRHAVRDITVELHTNLATPRLPETLLERMQETRSVRLANGSEMRILDPPSRLIHHAIHAVRSPVGSPLVRNLFEVAWMAASLDAAELLEAFEVSRHAGIDGQVATACALAEQLFGRVHGIPAPPAGAVQFWCARRLNWVEARPEGSARWSRFEATLARRHLFATRRASDRSPIPLIGVMLDSIGSERQRLQGALGARVRRARAGAAAVGDSLLVENLETGEVHLLNGNAARAWRSARDGIGRRELGRALRRSGLDRSESREAIGALLRCGLLAPQAA